MKIIVEEILELDDIIRYVEIIDKKENTLWSKVREGRVDLLNPAEEEIFAMDLEKIQRIRDGYDAKLGKTTFTLVIRGKVCILAYYVDKLIISVTCEPTLNFLKIYEISNNILRIIKKANLLLQH